MLYPNWRTDDDWKLPEWAEPYRQHIGNTGGNSIEDLLTDRSTNVQTNAILAAIIVAVESQVAMLYALHRAGLLNTEGTVAP